MAGAPVPSPDCQSGNCPELTAPVATPGLCLADGTPIAVVVTRNCTDGSVSEDGWIDLTTGTFTAGPPPAGTTACTSDRYDFELSGWLCDVLMDGSVAGIALVQIERDETTGAVIAITLLGVDGLPYVPSGTMTRCPEDRLAAEILCDGGNGNTPFVRFYTYSPVGSIPSRDTDLDGAAYVVIGPVVQCAASIGGTVDVNITNEPVEVTNPPGDPINIEGTVDIGNWRDDAEYIILCDDGTDPLTPFVRRFDVSDAGVVTTTDTELDGTTPYAVVGSAVICASGTQVEVVADPTADLRSGMVLLSGAGATWTLGVDTGGGKVKSITVVRRSGGTSTSVTVDDDFGNTTPVLTGESLTWGVSALEDEMTGTFVVTTSNAGDRVLVLWTEV